MCYTGSKLLPLNDLLPAATADGDDHMMHETHLNADLNHSNLLPSGAL
jgi:hypothetical protein